MGYSADAARGLVDRRLNRQTGTLVSIYLADEAGVFRLSPSRAALLYGHEAGCLEEPLEMADCRAEMKYELASTIVPPVFIRAIASTHVESSGHECRPRARKASAEARP